MPPMLHFLGRRKIEKVITIPEQSEPHRLSGNPCGLKVFHEGVEPVVDIVAVHGLNGHREKTWTASNGTLWLRDLLPRHLSNARILSWGYDADTHDVSRVSQLSIYGHARTLVSDLWLERELSEVEQSEDLPRIATENVEQTSERPIIFIAHSLGGIIVKSALIHSDAARPGALPTHRSIKLSTYGIIFMGTPHQGGNGVAIGKLILDIASVLIPTNKQLLQHLERNSEWLQQQLGQYGQISGDFVTKFAYEEYKTRIVGGRSVLVVPKESAVVPGDANPSQLPFMRTTSTWSDSSGVVAQRWQAENRPDIAYQHDASVTTYHSIPFLKNRKSVGRQKQLDILQQKLFGEESCQNVALVGLGGVGKTQVALEFAYWVKEMKPEYSVFWIPVVSIEIFEQAYTEIAKVLGISKTEEDEDLKVLVCQHLSSESAGKWLLIVDNLDDMNFLDGSVYSTGMFQYLPKSPTGRLLYTTRSRDVAVAVADADNVDLEEMNPEEASAFLTKSVSESLLHDKAAVVELLHELTYLPLAIAQAAAYLERKQMPIYKYLKLLKSTEKDLVSLMSRGFFDHTRYRYQESRNAVATTWLVSFEQIRNLDPTAANLLSFMSYIEPRAIPRSILPTVELDEEMENAIGTLLGYAFIARREDAEVYDMHSLVHTATQVWLQKQGRAEQTARDAVCHLADVFPSHNHANRAIWRSYLPHALQALRRSNIYRMEGRYALLMSVGRCLCNDRRYKEAIRCLEEVREQRREQFPKENVLRLESEHALAMAYLYDKRIKEAIELFGHLVAVQKKTLVEEDHSRLESEHTLAVLYLEDGRITEAIDILEQTVAVQKKTLVEEDHSRLVLEHTLAQAYLKDGRVKEAINILEHIVGVGKERLTEEDDDRLTLEHTLAHAYLENGRIKEAIDILEHVVAIRKKTLAEEDHSRLSLEHKLALAYVEDGRNKEAIDILEYVVTVRKKTLMEEDRCRLSSEHTLARAYVEDGRVKEAIDILEHVVAVRKKTLAEEDRYRLSSEHTLARAYLDDGQVKEAIDILEHVVGVEKERLAEEDRSRLALEQELTRAYLENGRVKEAINILEHVVAVQKKTLAEENPFRLALEQTLAHTYLKDERIKEAIDILEHVVAVQKKTLVEENRSRLAAERGLARAYLEDGRVKEAINIFEYVVAVEKKTVAKYHGGIASEHTLVGVRIQDKEATGILEYVVGKELGKEDHNRLVLEGALAYAYFEDGRIKEAIDILEHVVAVQRKMLAENDSLRLALEQGLAHTYLKDGRIKEAIDILEHVVAVQKKTLAEKDRLRLALERTLASTYFEDGRIKEAIDILEHVVGVEKGRLAEGNDDRLALEQRLARAYLKIGRTKEAIDIFEHVVAVQMKTLVKEDESRLALEHTLASAYLDDGRVKEAIEILEHVVAVKKKTLVEEDHNRLASEHMLAHAYLKGKLVKEAIQLLEHVVEVTKQIFAEDYPHRLASLNLLNAARDEL